jgi:hypothetical protein
MKADYLKARNAEIAKMKVKGKKNPEIAKTFGLTVKGLDKVLSREEVREILNRSYNKIVSEIEAVTDRVILVAKQLDKKVINPDDKKMSWDANKLILQSHGLLPTQHQSLVHQTFINRQTNIIPPFISELAKKHFGEIIDIGAEDEVEPDNQKER